MSLFLCDCCLCVSCSDLELKPQGKLIVTVVRANSLKNHEMIGKSDPYAVVYIRPLFKLKTKTINNNLNLVWDQTFELIAEDKETQSLILEVLFLYIPLISTSKLMRYVSLFHIHDHF